MALPEVAFLEEATETVPRSTPSGSDADKIT